MHGFRSRRAAAVLGAAAAVLAAGCGDARIEKLSTGISRDSALKILAEGSTGGDSLANVYKQETYLLDGQLTNVLFYNRKGVTQSEDPAVAADALTPIVVSGGKVTGWGWTYYDSLAKANNIPVPPRK